MRSEVKCSLTVVSNHGNSPLTLQGGDLDQKVRQWKKTGRSFDETLIVDWFIQLTTAIMYIHERRILHRDIKTRLIVI